MKLSKRSDVVPIKCTNPDCGFEFIGTNFVHSSNSDVVATGNTTSCPQCDSIAKYADFRVDRQGQMYVAELFEDLKKIDSSEKLEAIKVSLAANDDIGAEEFVDALAEVEPSFNRYREAILALPLPFLAFFISTVIGLISMMIAFRANSLAEISSDIASQQLELSKRQFEYQKNKDIEALKATAAEQRELKETQQQVDELQRQLDQMLKEMESERVIKPRPLLKASLRNKPCPCGSGRKSKKCHPRGVV